MPKVDFSQIDDVQDYTPIPADKYPCVLEEVQEAQTQNQDEMWKLRWRVDGGKYAGRVVFDNMVFSQAALKRVKLICSRLGLDVSGELNLTPAMVKGRKALVSVEIEEYEDDSGNTKARNIVPFAGYERIDGDEAPAGKKAKGKTWPQNEDEDAGEGNLAF